MFRSKTTSSKSQRKKEKRIMKRAKEDPTLENIARAVSSQVESTTGLPKDLTNLIADYTVEPDVRITQKPKGAKRRPRAIAVLRKIMEEAGTKEDYDDIISEYKPKQGGLTDKAVLDILDSVDKKLLIGDPDATEDNKLLREINALQDSLRKSQGVKAQRKERADTAFGEKIQTAIEQSLLEEPEEQKVETQIEIPSTSEMGTQVRPSRGEMATQVRPSRSEMGTQTKTATQYRREVERDIRNSIRLQSKRREMVDKRKMDELQRRVEGMEIVRPSRVSYKPPTERTDLDNLFRPVGETRDDREVSNLMDWMVDHVVAKSDARQVREEKYDYEEEEEVKEEVQRPVTTTASSNIGFGRDQTFGDNFMREINSSLTGLEPNTLIPVIGTSQPTINDTIDEPEEKLYYGNDDYEDKELQNNELEGPADEFPHADPNEQGPLRNANSLYLADNNQYTEAQKAILRRSENNRQIRNRIRKSNLDLALGAMGPPEGERDDDNYDFEEEKEQEGIGGGLGDIGRNDEDEEIQGIRARETVENAIEQELIKPRTQWVGNRGVTADFQRTAIANRMADTLSRSSGLNAMRKTPIPWTRPSRTYANNSVGLIRNSTRSMILATNLLEP